MLTERKDLDLELTSEISMLRLYYSRMCLIICFQILLFLFHFLLFLIVLSSECNSVAISPTAFVLFWWPIFSSIVSKLER